MVANNIILAIICWVLVKAEHQGSWKGDIMVDEIPRLAKGLQSDDLVNVHDDDWNYAIDCGKLSLIYMIHLMIKYFPFIGEILVFLAYRIGESVDLPVHGKPYLSPHHSEPLECLQTQYTGEEFRLSPQCMDDFRFSDVT